MRLQALQEPAVRYFLEVVRAGSVKDAAQKLNVAPSAVSRQVARLEQELDTLLFDRHARGMVPNAAGELLAAHARRALRRRRLAWALLYEPVDPLVDAERLVYRRTYCRHMAGLLRQAIAAGEIPEQNVEMSAAALVGAIAESLVGPLSPVAGQIVAQEDIIATLVRFCRRSVGAADAAALRSVATGRQDAP